MGKKGKPRRPKPCKVGRQPAAERPLVSACMIVKDEEALLPVCLKSIKDFVDEIIVVDTGSTDRTMDIAREFGAKVYEHPWEDNFSLHRNQSIGYATGEWIFIIDADEELIVPRGIKSLRQAFREMPPQVAICGLKLIDLREEKYNMEMLTGRFFRHGNIEYEGRVHNQPKVLPLTDDGQAAIMLALSGAHLLHRGYALSWERMQAKIQRTRNLLKLQLRDKPEDINSMFYMCQGYMQEGNAAAALEWGGRYISTVRKMPYAPERQMEGLYVLCTLAAMSINNTPLAKSYIEAGLAINPDNIDLCFLLSDYGVALQRLDNLNDYSGLVKSGCEMYWNAFGKFQEDPASMGLHTFYKMGIESQVIMAHRLSTIHFAEARRMQALVDALIPRVDVSLRDMVFGERDLNAKRWNEMFATPPPAAGYPDRSEIPGLTQAEEEGIPESIIPITLESLGGGHA